MVSERRTRITDVGTLRALANPIRYRILGHLMATGAQTASACASVVGATPSNCSYHLRELARYGLVERAADGPEGDGRDRPWRPTLTGYGTGPDDDDSDLQPAALVATRALSHLGVDDSASLAHAAIDAHDDLPAEWRRAEVLSTYGLAVTAAELTALTAAIDAILRPYIGLTREDMPAGAQPVHVIVDAFRRRTVGPPT